MAYARIPVSENPTLACEDGGNHFRPFHPASTLIPPVPSTETTTPFGSPLSNQPVRFLSTERSVKILSSCGPRVGPNTRNAAMSLPRPGEAPERSADQMSCGQRRSGSGGALPKGGRGEVSVAVCRPQGVERFDDAAGPDLLYPLEWTFGVVRSKLHRPVYVFGRGNAF